MNDRMNFVISGWSGVGATTISLYVAHYFSMRYLYLGNVFRLLGERIGYAQEGHDRVRADEFIEHYLGKLIDKQAMELLLHDRGLLLESDIAMFVLGKQPFVKSVFLTCDWNERVRRVVGDERSDAEMVLKARDAQLTQVYKDLWGISIFDAGEIVDSYEFVLDTTELSIDETVARVLSYLQGVQVSSSDFSVQSTLFAAGGKAALRSRLTELDLLVPGESFLEGLCAGFADEIASLPDDARRLLLVE